MVDVTKYLDIYLSEMDEHLQNLNKSLLSFEKNPTDISYLDELLRSSHTIKSSSAAMGFSGTAALTHAMEDLFDAARHDSNVMTKQRINLLFSVIDELEKSTQHIKTSGTENDLANLVKKIGSVDKSTSEGKSKIQKIATTEEQPVKHEAIDYIKVPVERMDVLLGIMEELLLGKMKMEQVHCADQQSKQVVGHLKRSITDMQNQVMLLRLVPIEQVLVYFPRMVRDLANKNSKNIDFVITNENTELDRSIVDRLGEPMTHLLRNAIDHGIEKSGRIDLIVQRENDHAKIIVQDNGAGINVAKVREEAIKRGIISQGDAAKYTDEKIVDLIFDPRLSTSSTITETSGRGVGLSAVKEFVDNISGNVRVISPYNGSGTRFEIEVPLTLAIIQVLLVEIDAIKYGIPFSVIERSISIKHEKIKKMAGRKIAIIDDTSIPIIDLHDLLNKSVKKTDNDSKKESFLVIVNKNGRTVAIAVDKLISNQEIMIKPLPDMLKHTKGFSGATMLGDGRTVLILDVTGIIDLSEKERQ